MVGRAAASLREGSSGSSPTPATRADAGPNGGGSEPHSLSQAFGGGPLPAERIGRGTAGADAASLTCQSCRTRLWPSVVGTGAKKARLGLVVGAVVALTTWTVLVPATMSGAAPSPARPTPAAGRHCGLFYSMVKWVDASHIQGHFYAYGVLHMKCLEGFRIATLALYGQRRPSGFKCVVAAPIGSGETQEKPESGSCYKGNPQKKSTLQYVSWAPETECAIPDPPYTPETLPGKCHS